MNKATKQALFDNAKSVYSEFLEGRKDKRLHFSVTHKTRVIIAKECTALGLANNDYVLLAALAFDRNAINIAAKLAVTIGKVNKLINRKAVKVKKPTTSYTVNKGFMKKLIEAKERKAMAKPSNTAPREAVCIRLTAPAKELLKSKADEMGMSMSDFVEFVVSNFDILAISNAIDEINGKLDAVLEQQ